jgi:hypothetical protein
VAPGEEAPALDKGRAIQLLAQHFAAACKGWREAKVDLRKPEVSQNIYALGWESSLLG